MKRKALLIGNTNGLPGVKRDIESFSDFLQSDRGGAWYSSEIITLLDVSKTNLEQLVATTKAESPDYTICLYSGHGAQKRETILEINKYNERIYESLLFDIARRQLNIFDCCRAILQEEMRNFSACNAKFGVFENKSLVRAAYDSRIISAIPQNARLYSCSIGETSSDTSSGGVYITHLLKATQSIANGPLTIGQAHESASREVQAFCSANHLNAQHPDAILPKCFSSQSLVMSI